MRQQLVDKVESGEEFVFNVGEITISLFVGIIEWKANLDKKGRISGAMY